MPRDSNRLRKRFFLNLDGTGQSEYSKAGELLDGKKTSPAVSNVARIGRATLLEDEENSIEQVVYYQTGLASRAETGLFQKAYDGGWGLGLISNVREAYGFLCNNYDYGDEIYITGFSRGAFTARSVAGLIGRCGILTKRGLEQFYEAFDYYEDYKNYLKAHKPCPVSEEAGTTRFKNPNTGKPITIRAVGVWDTVGALGGDFSFHDVSIGDHIEYGFHILSLNEKRGYYEPTLWECDPKKPRPLTNLEQCWLVGDHSNIGGSWPDQQIADISLAWIMSRFETLGVKFDQNYLYREYVKFNDFVKNKGPILAGSDGNDEGPPYPKDAGLNPRTWAEGRTRLLSPNSASGGGEKLREPANFHQPVLHPATWVPPREAYIAQDGPLLQKTNETFHPAVRARHFSKNQAKLGAHDAAPYDPKQMIGIWKYPSAQKDGRIGEATEGPLEYSRNLDGKTVTVTESAMGRHEQIYLALYDQDPVLQKRDGSIWKKVLGGEGPPEDIKKIATRLRAGEDVQDTMPSVKV